MVGCILFTFNLVTRPSTVSGLEFVCTVWLTFVFALLGGLMLGREYPSDEAVEAKIKERD